MHSTLNDGRRTLKWRFRPASDLVSDGECRNQCSELRARTSRMPYMDSEAIAAVLAFYGRGDEALAISLMLKAT